MVKIQGEIVIARPVEEVFDFVADERHEPRYNPRMLHVEKVTPGPIGKGTRWVATIESRRRPVEITLEVTEYARPNRLGSTTTMSTADIVGGVTFEPRPGGTRMRWSWELLPKGVARVLTPVIMLMGRRQEEQIWTGLKRYLEETAPHDARS